MIDRITNSETKQDKIVFPSDLNNNSTLFGGLAMKWMDEVAYITAIRFTKRKMVTVSVEKIQFLLPIKTGEIIEIIGKIIKVGYVKLEILVNINIEDLNSDQKQKAVSATFIFASVDELNKPIAIENFDENRNSEKYR
jgi:acyl-CoA hydrolase